MHILTITTILPERVKAGEENGSVAIFLKSDSIGGRIMTSGLDRHVESVQKDKANGDGKVCLFLENNKKWCAWVFDFNGDDDVVGHDDKSNAENSIVGNIDHTSSS